MRPLSVVVCAALLGSCGGKKSDVTKVADEPSTVVGLAADDNGIAWLASGKSDVELKFKPLDSPPVLIARGPIFHVVLDKDAVYWSAGEHIWSSPRRKAEPRQLAEIDDTTVGLQIDGGFLYWALPTKVGRIALAGDAVSQVVIAQPPGEGRIKALAVADGHTVIAVDGNNSRTTLWDVSGEPRKIGEYSGDSRGLAVAGNQILWSHNAGSDDEVLVLGFNGTQTDAIAGRLVTATPGNVYIAKADGTFVVTGGSQRRIANRAVTGTATSNRFYAVFGNTIGYVATR